MESDSASPRPHQHHLPRRRWQRRPDTLSPVALNYRRPATVSWKNAGAADQTIYLFVDTVKAGGGEADYNVLPSLN